MQERVKMVPHLKVIYDRIQSLISRPINEIVQEGVIQIWRRREHDVGPTWGNTISILLHEYVPEHRSRYKKNLPGGQSTIVIQIDSSFESHVK